MDYGIIFPDDVIPERAVEMMQKKCKEGYFYASRYKDEEFYLCGGDCEGCPAQQIYKFLLTLYKEGKK